MSFDAKLQVNRYHLIGRHVHPTLTGGTAFSYERFQLTIGLGYAWGSKERERRPPEVTDLPLEEPGFMKDGEFYYKILKVIIGFAF
jgi:hypothetical protein